MQELVLDDVYDVWLTSFWQTPVGYAILAVSVMAIGLLFYALIRLIMRYRRGSTKDQVLRELRMLTKESNPKKLYRELTVIIKRYAQWRFGFPRGMTDYEFTTLLAELGMDGQQENQRIISEAQVVKFGHGMVLKEVIQKHIADSIAFVEVTAKEERA